MMLLPSDRSSLHREPTELTLAVPSPRARLLRLPTGAAEWRERKDRGIHSGQRCWESLIDGAAVSALTGRDREDEEVDGLTSLTDIAEL